MKTEIFTARSVHIMLAAQIRHLTAIPHHLITILRTLNGCALAITCSVKVFSSALSAGQMGGAMRGSVR